VGNRPSSANGRRQASRLLELRWQGDHPDLEQQAGSSVEKTDHDRAVPFANATEDDLRFARFMLYEIEAILSVRKVDTTDLERMTKMCRRRSWLKQ